MWGLFQSQPLGHLKEICSQELYMYWLTDDIYSSIRNNYTPRVITSNRWKLQHKKELKLGCSENTIFSQHEITMVYIQATAVSSQRTTAPFYGGKIMC